MRCTACTFIFAGNGDDAQIEKEIAAFWDFIGIEGEILEKTETCAANIYRVLRMARVDLPNNFDELFDVEYSRSIDADEHIAAAPEDLTLAAYAEANHFPELRAEAERIAAAKDTAAFYGHPVHYILEENNSEKAKQTVDLLVQTLYRANRLQSARIIIIDEESFGMRGMNEALRKLYRNFQGGMIVVSLAASGSNGEYADASEDLIAKICRLAVQHQHEVELGGLISGTPVHRIESERWMHIPGNEPLFSANIHFNCQIGEIPCPEFHVRTGGKDITDAFRTM